MGDGLKRMAFLLVVLTACYVGGYIAFRLSAVERWMMDGADYVIFSQDQAYLYYLWRPLTYVDAILTGMRFHIGPHQAVTQ